MDVDEGRRSDNLVGAGLARDGVSTGNIFVECAGLIAGKPAPTRFVLGELLEADPGIILAAERADLIPLDVFAHQRKGRRVRQRHP